MSASAERSPAAQDAYLRLSSALRDSDFAGWDPYDALSAPWLRSIARTPLLRRAAIQGVKRAPLNLRPLLGVKPLRHTKGLALCASAYARLARAGQRSGPAPEGADDAQEGDADAGRIARRLARELMARAIPSGAGSGWGYDFDVQTRWGYYRRGTPNAVVTAFVAHALLDVAELHGSDPQGHDGGPQEQDSERFLRAARDAVAYACSQLAVRQENGESYFAYFAESRTPIHNANMLLASMVGRSAEGHSEAHRIAQAAVTYTLRRQQPDGSWRYGEAAGLEWVDGFHTAYVLGDLDRWHERAGEPSVEDALRRGLDLYLTRLIDPDGAPRASLSSRYPVDIHACATAVSTLSRLARWDPRAAATAEWVLDWTLAHMARADGQFAFQRHRHRRDSTPYVRWGSAHMLLALADHTVSRDPSLSSSVSA
jgi:hypothetical protein